MEYQIIPQPDEYQESSPLLLPPPISHDSRAKIALGAFLAVFSTVVFTFIGVVIKAQGLDFGDVALVRCGTQVKRKKIRDAEAIMP